MRTKKLDGQPQLIASVPARKEPAGAADGSTRSVTFPLATPPRTSRHEFMWVSHGPEEEPLEPLNRERGQIDIRWIVPPIERPFLFTKTEGFTSYKPESSSVIRASQRWWIEVTFNSESDILIFQKATRGSGVRLINQDRRYYVEDPRIPDSLSMGNVLESARDCLYSLNAAVSVVCPYCEPAILHCVVEIYTTGIGRSIVLRQMIQPGTHELNCVEEFLKSDSENVGAILDLASSDRDMSDALYYLGQTDTTWPNLYKACEIVADRKGGEHRLIESGLCSRKDWKRFKHTANHQEAVGRFSRHAKTKGSPPEHPMDLREAKRFTRDLLGAWISSHLTDCER